MAQLKPITASRFYVEFDNLTDKMVKSVTEVKFQGKTAGHEKPIASTKDGKTLWQTTSSGFEEHPTFTLEVYLCEGDMDFYNWMKGTIPASELGDGKWGDNRKNGSIVAYDPSDQEILRWDIQNAWIKSYKVSDFSSDGKDLAFETCEFVCEDIKRKK